MNSRRPPRKGPNCLWRNETLKRIVRTLIEDIIADLDTEASEVVLTIHWVGGVHTEVRVPRRRRGTATATRA